MGSLALVVLLPLSIGAVGCAWIGHSDAPVRRAVCAWFAAAVTAAALALLLMPAGAVFDGQVLLSGAEWVPAIGLNANFRLDGLALMFGLLITGVGLLIILYAAYYLHHDDPAGKFYALLMLFMAAMLGIALSDNLLLLVVFWELTSVSSFLLVGYWGHRADARAGARMALAVTGGGGLALLAGVVLLGQIGGSYDLSVLLGRGAALQQDARFTPAMLLILLGCFTKSAQWPFHFWLPEAMAAPTPVSAYLHSATMVKAGIFLIARLYPVFHGSALFESIVTSVGLATMVFGAYVAVFRHDLKGLLAYSTISHLGLIVFLLGLDSPLSAVAAVFHILNHATFKASLFMTAGIIDHETGTRDMRQLGGLMRFMPVTATLAMVAAAAMAGVPLFNGFLSKEMFFDEAADARHGLVWGIGVPLLATFGGICAVAYSLRFIHDVFFNGEPKPLPNGVPHEPPLFMRAPVILLVVLCVIVGVAPALTLGPLVRVAAGAVLGQAPPEYQLALWHGFNLPLLMSAIALVGGVAMYFALQHQYKLHLHHPRGITGRLLFTRAIDGLFGWSGRWLSRTETASLQRYVALMLGAALVLSLWVVMAGDGPLAVTRAPLASTPMAWVLWALTLLCCAALVRTHHLRLRAVVLVGVVGLVVAHRLRRAVGARSGVDAAVGRDRLGGVAADGAGAAAGHLAARIVHRASHARCAAVARTRRRHRLAGLAGHAQRGHLAVVVLPRQGAACGWRQQCRQCHPGRLPRLRHLRRDHRARHRRPRRAGAARRPARAPRWPRCARPIARLHAGAVAVARGGPCGAAAGAGGVGLSVLAWPQPARRRLHRRPRHRGGAAAAVHGDGAERCRSGPARRGRAALRALDRRRAGHRRTHRRGADAHRPALLDQRLRPPGGAAVRRTGAGVGGAVRPRCVHHRGRRHAADVVGAGRRQQGAATGMSDILSMEFLLATGIGVVSATGAYLLLRGRTFAVVLGLTLLGYGVNLFIFVMGRLWSASAPIVGATPVVADPLPQALVLTAIVIGFATVGFVLELALRSHQDNGSDHVDGREPGRRR